MSKRQKRPEPVEICDYLRAVPGGKPFGSELWWDLQVRRPDGVWIDVQSGPRNSMLWHDLKAYNALRDAEEAAE